MRIRAAALALAAAMVPVGAATGCGAVTPVEIQAASAPPPAAAALQIAIDRFNATAGGSITAQQAVLTGLVAAGQSSVQRVCPPVTVTISMEPVYARLAPSAGWHPGTGTLAGTIYAVPTLIRIYSGDRITGTDLTDLHLTIDGGRVTLPAICLR